MFYITLENGDEISTYDPIAYEKVDVECIESNLYPEPHMFSYAGDVSAYIILHEKYEEADEVTRAKMHYLMVNDLKNKSIDEYLCLINIHQGDLVQFARLEVSNSFGIDVDDSRLFYFDFVRYAHDHYETSSEYNEFHHDGNYWVVYNVGDLI